MNKIDVELLRMLPQTSEKAKALLEGLAARERGMAVTYYHVAKKLVRDKKLDFNRADFKEIGSVLTQCGVGQFDPKDQARAFRWNYNLVSVANIALNKADVAGLKARARTRPRPLPKLAPRRDRVVVENAERIPVYSKGLPRVNSMTISKNGCQIDLAFEDLTLEKCKQIAMVLENLPKAM